MFHRLGSPLFHRAPPRLPRTPRLYFNSCTNFDLKSAARSGRRERTLSETRLRVDQRESNDFRQAPRPAFPETFSPSWGDALVVCIYSESLE